MTDLFRALKIEKENDKQTVNLVEISENELMEGNVVVDVTHSTLNYKDGLAMTGSSPIVRSFPMIPGIDFSGNVRSSEDPNFSHGDRVVLNGFGLSESHFGGYSERARVNSEHLIKLPENISNRQAMEIGTAGYTAMLCVLGLEDSNIKPGDGDILVTGASGGVGSVAISLLSTLGYSVIASTGRLSEAEYLKELGANSLIDRGELSEASRPLGKERWIGAIDSVMAPMDKRLKAWQRLSKDLDMEKLGKMVIETTLDEIINFGQSIIDGQVRGRVVVNISE